MVKVNQLQRAHERPFNSPTNASPEKDKNRGIVKNNFLKIDALQAAEIGIKGH
jgi:hypothetical protein